MQVSVRGYRPVDLAAVARKANDRVCCSSMVKVFELVPQVISRIFGNGSWMRSDNVEK